MNAADVLDAIDEAERPHAALLREAWSIDGLAVPVMPEARSWHAYEVKVSRDDFRRELERWPEKAARALALSDVFSFAVPAGLLIPSEVTARAPGRGARWRKRLWLPPNVGLVEVVDGPLGRETRWLVQPHRSSVRRKLTAGEQVQLQRFLLQEGERRGGPALRQEEQHNA